MGASLSKKADADLDAIDERIAWPAIGMDECAQDDCGQRTIRESWFTLARAMHVDAEPEESGCAGDSGEPDHFATSLTAPSKKRR